MSIAINRYYLSQVEYWTQIGSHKGEWIAFAWFTCHSDAEAFVAWQRTFTPPLTYRIVDLEEE